MRIVLILALIFFPIKAFACDNPWPDLQKEIEAFGWKIAELEGPQKSNFIYHFNNDLEPVTNYKPDHLFLASHKFEPSMRAILVTDGCVIAGGQMKEETAAHYMAETPDGI